MNIQGDTIVFKSYRGNYEVEESGRKNCTVRMIPPNEWDAVMEFGYDLAGEAQTSNSQKKIMIVCADNQMRYFTRELTYVEIIGDVLYNKLVLFCWKSEGEY
jgi:hypothetical protein